MSALQHLQQRLRSGAEASSSGPAPRPLRAGLGPQQRRRRAPPHPAASSPAERDPFYPQSGAEQLQREAAAARRAAASPPLSPPPPTLAAPASQRRAPPRAAGAPDADVLIEFRDVHKSFGSKKILRGASFKIRRGEAVGIIGSSGTGKSTALRLAAGLLEPDQGEIWIKGEPRRGLLSDDDTSGKLKVGLVFQSGALFDSLTVRENVGFTLYEHTSLPAARVEAAVADSLAKVGLSGVESLYPSELSGGMKKRVALARAIVKDLGAGDDEPEELIMYDEPTAGLDPVASTVIEDLIRSMHEPDAASSLASSDDGGGGAVAAAGAANGAAAGAANGAGGGGEAHGRRRPATGGITSYVVVTHQHSTIRRAVDRIIFLHAGVVVWEGSVAEFDATEEPIVRQFASGSLQGPIVYL